MLQVEPAGTATRAIDAFTTVGSQTFVEPTRYVVGLLHELWDPAHIDNRPVRIADARDCGEVDCQMQDWVLVKPLPPIGQSKPHTIGYSYQSKEERLEVEISSGKATTSGKVDELHFLRLEKEVETRLLSRRRNFLYTPEYPITQGPSWIEWAPVVEARDMEKRAYIERAYNIVIHRPFQRIQTDMGT